MAEPKLFVKSSHYSEGVVTAGGWLYFSMTQISQIMAVPLEGEPVPRVWSHVPGANGHVVDRSGTHTVMSSTGAFLRLNGDGAITKVIATEAGGDDLVYPNGVKIDHVRGGFYATDSGYKETPKHIDGEAKGRVIRVDRDDNVSVVAGDLAYANGIGLSPDAKTLYVTASTDRMIWSYPIRADGTLGDRSHFARVPTIEGTETVPDGITMTADGFLCVAHYGAREVLVYAPDGQLARRVSAGNRCTSHVALDEEKGRAYVSGGIESESGAGAIFIVDL